MMGLGSGGFSEDIFISKIAIERIALSLSARILPVGTVTMTEC